MVATKKKEYSHSQSYSSVYAWAHKYWLFFQVGDEVVVTFKNHSLIINFLWQNSNEKTRKLAKLEKTLAVYVIVLLVSIVRCCPIQQKQRTQTTRTERIIRWQRQQKPPELEKSEQHRHHHPKQRRNPPPKNKTKALDCLRPLPRRVLVLNLLV